MYKKNTILIGTELECMVDFADTQIFNLGLIRSLIILKMKKKIRANYWKTKMCKYMNLFQILLEYRRLNYLSILILKVI